MTVGNAIPFPNPRQLKRVFILMMINNGTVYGYDILRKIEKELLIKMTSSELYLTLRKMETEKIISSIWQTTHKKPKRVYSLTPHGKEILEKTKSGLRENFENITKKLQ